LPENEPRTRRAKRFLTPSQEYEIRLQPVRHEPRGRRDRLRSAGRPVHNHADQTGRRGWRVVDKLAASEPGVMGRKRAWELEDAKAEMARLSEACKELAGSSHWWREKTVGPEWPSPAPGAMRPPRLGCSTWSTRPSVPPGRRRQQESSEVSVRSSSNGAPRLGRAQRPRRDRTPCPGAGNGIFYGIAGGSGRPTNSWK
jgi:transposase